MNTLNILIILVACDTEKHANYTQSVILLYISTLKINFVNDYIELFYCCSKNYDKCHAPLFMYTNTLNNMIRPVSLDLRKHLLKLIKIDWFCILLWLILIKLRIFHDSCKYK